jgi:hypothetical protein
VSVGGVGASFQRVSDTQLKVVVPVRALGGRATVRVTTLGGSVEGVSAPFTYVAPPAPRVDTLSPAVGRARAWNTIEVGGANFGMATAVTADGASVKFTKLADGRLRVFLPPRAAGTVRVQVVTPGGTSAATTAANFTYRA